MDFVRQQILGHSRSSSRSQSRPDAQRPPQPPQMSDPHLNYHHQPPQVGDPRAGYHHRRQSSGTQQYSIRYMSPSAAQTPIARYPPAPPYAVPGRRRMGYPPQQPPPMEPRYLYSPSIDHTPSRRIEDPFMPMPPHEPHTPQSRWLSEHPMDRLDYDLRFSRSGDRVLWQLVQTPAKYFLGPEGAIKLLHHMIGSMYRVIEVRKGDPTAQLLISGMRNGSLFTDLPCWTYNGMVLGEWTSAARLIARSRGLYGPEPEADCIADTVLACLESWRYDQQDCLAAATEWLDNGAIVDPAKPLDQAITSYLKNRETHFALFASFGDTWQTLYRHDKIWTCWIDPLLLGRVADDLLLDKYFSGRTETPFKTTDELMHDTFIEEFYKTMYCSHHKTMAPLLNDKAKVAETFAREAQQLASTNCASEEPAEEN